MKKIFSLLLLTLFIPITTSKNVYADNISSNYTEIVLDAQTNRVLYGNKINDKKYPASTTKILTALVIIENCNLNEEVEVKKETVGVEGSSIYLEEGEILTVKDLLYGLMLRSGNDCAETLAVHCSGSISAFSDLMNITAEKLGALNSNFVNPHGLHNDNHYTTAYDLAIISSYAIKNKVFKEICSTKTVKIPFSTKKTFRYLKNKNKMLDSFEGCNGIKTGYTKKSGRCLVTSSERNGMQLVSVVLDCQPMWERSKTLLEYCFDNFKYEKIIAKENIVDFVKVNNSNKKIPVYIKNDVIIPLTLSEKEKLRVKYNLPESIDYSYEKGIEIGNIEIYIENNLIFTEKIYTIL